MITFSTTILRFEKQGEKTGWTYIEIPDGVPEQLKPGNKKEFKVKGKLDDYAIKRMSLLPIGGGRFIMALNADIRKALGKRKGALIEVKLAADNSDFIFNAEFLECIADEPAAMLFFKSLTGSHQRYFSKWIDSAKTEPTKTKRIAMVIKTMVRKMDFGAMLREERDERRMLGR